MTDNAFHQPHKPLEAVLETQAALVPMLEAALEDVCLSLSAFETDKEAARWQMRLILDGNQREAFERRLERLRAHYPLPAPVLSPLQIRDWVQLVQQHFKPIRAGRFYLHGSHIDTPPPVASLPLLMDAGAAFGTGEHETTRGCLLALDTLLKQRRRARSIARVLDMGCGSGVLAIAAAGALRVPVDAVDNDAVSVDVARENIRRNRVARYVRAQCGNGYDASLARGRYDLILANILARPLMRMARDLRAHLNPGGVAILSGLLVRQEAMVLFAHRCNGLRLQTQLRIGPWSVLVLRG